MNQAIITKRKNRVRSKVTGSAARPRLSVKVTNRHVSAQLVDDGAGQTLVAVTTVKAEVAKKTMTEQAVWVGEQIAEKAKKVKVKQVVFDRGARIYHGRIKALAEAARAKGLEF